MSNYEQVIARYISTVRMNPYIPHEPTAKQALFLMHDHIPELLFGGAAGPGKTDGLLMAALQYVDVPEYAALLLRRTYADLALPGAIMDRSHTWLQGKVGVHWSDDKKTWTFPGGATLTFGYLDGPRDHFRYQSSEFQFVGFDELSQFKKNQYLYLHSRLRRLIDSDIPIRMRAASNPGDIGHEWVKERFINPKTREKDCVFIPAILSDNPHIDRETYIKSLEKLDPVTREQLLNGNWDIRPEGNLFKREWFDRKIVASGPGQYQALCRFWDKAATEGAGDFTVGALVGLISGRYYVLNIRRTQSSPAGVESLIQQTAISDKAKYGPIVKIRIEQEPGSSGVNDIDHYARQVLPGYNFAGVKSTGSKISRAGIVSSAAECGNLWVIQDYWTDDYLTELCLFPQTGVHDDQVDATSGAVIVLSQGIRNTANEAKIGDAVASSASGYDELGINLDDELGEIW